MTLGEWFTSRGIQTSSLPSHDPNKHTGARLQENELIDSYFETKWDSKRAYGIFNKKKKKFVRNLHRHCREKYQVLSLTYIEHNNEGTFMLQSLYQLPIRQGVLLPTPEKMMTKDGFRQYLVQELIKISNIYQRKMQKLQTALEVLNQPISKIRPKRTKKKKNQKSKLEKSED